jgi:hypothetical protein
MAPHPLAADRRPLVDREQGDHVNDRQGYALTHPLNDPDGDLDPYRVMRRHATGLLLMSILAVDR